MCECVSVSSEWGEGVTRHRVRYWPPEIPLHLSLARALSPPFPLSRSLYLSISLSHTLGVSADLPLGWGGGVTVIASDTGHQRFHQVQERLIDLPSERERGREGEREGERGRERERDR